MTPIARIHVVLMLALVVLAHDRAARAGSCAPCGRSFAMCEAPTTKSYRIEPGFCPQQIVCMIPNCVADHGSTCCGPFGVPPVFASGSYVMVRQTREGHEQVAKFLADMGAYKPPQPAP